MLIEEWIKSPPGSRPLLEKAISEQYRKALTAQWEGLKHDNLTQWLQENICAIQKLTDSDYDDLDNLVAALLDENEAEAVEPDTALPLAALKPSAKQKQMLVGNGVMPPAEEIALRVRSILNELDKNQKGNAI